jgi:hypothetical protein
MRGRCTALPHVHPWGGASSYWAVSTCEPSPYVRPPGRRSRSVECRDNIFLLLARKSPTSCRKSLLKCPQRADVSPLQPQESRSVGIYQRESRRARSPAVRPPSKVRRLSLDDAQDAFLPARARGRSARARGRPLTRRRSLSGGVRAATGKRGEGPPGVSGGKAAPHLTRRLRNWRFPRQIPPSLGRAASRTPGRCNATRPLCRTYGSPAGGASGRSGQVLCRSVRLTFFRRFVERYVVERLATARAAHTRRPRRLRRDGLPRALHPARCRFRL